MKNNVVEITHETYDLIAKDYSTSVEETINGWVGRFEKGLLDKFRFSEVMFRSGWPFVLDIGCGNGKDTEYLMRQHAEVISTDISSGMLEVAKKRVPDGIFCQMDMRTLGFPAETFNGVWANGCIYHVPKSDFPKVLSEVYRILRGPTGVFSFNFKIGSGEGLEESPRSFKGGPRFYAYYTLEEMKGLLRQVGFKIIDVQKYPKKVFGEKIVHISAWKPPLKRCKT